MSNVHTTFQPRNNAHHNQHNPDLFLISITSFWTHNEIAPSSNYMQHPSSRQSGVPQDQGIIFELHPNQGTPIKRSKAPPCSTVYSRDVYGNSLVVDILGDALPSSSFSASKHSSIEPPRPSDLIIVNSTNNLRANDTIIHHYSDSMETFYNLELRGGTSG